MGASPVQVGLLMSIYSLMQFLFAPFWGKLSDKKGRRPILLFCLLGETLSYLVFAFSRSVEMLIIARGLAGFFGASLSTASAVISDLTARNERSRGMALIGVAFGLGFIFGPALGGGLSILGEKISAEKYFSTTFTMTGVAILCFLTFLAAIKILPETRKPHSPSEHSKTGRLLALYQELQKPTVGGLILVFFCASMAMSCMEGMLAIFVKDKFNWGIEEISFGFAYIGILATINQGFLVRKLLPKWGERKMMTIGIVVLGCGLTMIAFANELWILGLAMTLVPFGHAFTNPSILGAISLLTNRDEQGSAMGTTQGTASLGRILGPYLGGVVYQNINTSAPFMISGMMMSFALVIALYIGKRIPTEAKKA